MREESSHRKKPDSPQEKSDDTPNHGTPVAVSALSPAYHGAIIDDIRVYDRALTLAEIRTLSREGE